LTSKGQKVTLRKLFIRLTPLSTKDSTEAIEFIFKKHVSKRVLFDTHFALLPNFPAPVAMMGLWEG
jgi:hypothetical protein